MRAKTGRNILLALFLSSSLTLVFAVFYTFYPVISLILRGLWNGIVSSRPDSNGIAAVAGGISESFLGVLVVVAPILFFIIFTLLQKRTMKN
jgi:uncharacterized membrane protein